MPKQEKQKRHKCSICGRVRNEKYLEPIGFQPENRPFHQTQTRYGNKCWSCVDNPDCQHKAQIYSSY